MDNATNKNPKILIVEDEVTLRGVLVDTLNQNGLPTLEAGNGEEGLQIAFSMHPTLILLNILMPKMDGLTMLKRLREDTWGKNVPVIILTNVEPEAKELDEIVKYRASFYLIKTTTNLDNIINKIRELLREQLK